MNSDIEISNSPPKQQSQSKLQQQQQQQENILIAKESIYVLPEAKISQKQRQNYQENHRNSDIYGSTQGSFSFYTPTKSQQVFNFNLKRDSVFEDTKNRSLYSRDQISLLTDNVGLQKKRQSLNIVSRFNIDIKNKKSRLAPVTIQKCEPSSNQKKGTKNQLTMKYSQGKELPDYKQYSGPFNIPHIPEDGVQIEIDESELDIIDKIANIDGLDDEISKSKMKCFGEVKNNIVKNQSDYYNQYKNINSILDAEQFFEGNKVSNYSQMLERTLKNKLIPKKFGLCSYFVKSNVSNKSIPRRQSEITNGNRQKSMTSQKSITPSIISNQSNQIRPNSISELKLSLASPPKISGQQLSQFSPSQILQINQNDDKKLQSFNNNISETNLQQQPDNNLQKQNISLHQDSNLIRVSKFKIESNNNNNQNKPSKSYFIDQSYNQLSSSKVQNQNYNNNQSQEQTTKFNFNLKEEEQDIQTNQNNEQQNQQQQSAIAIKFKEKLPFFIKPNSKNHENTKKSNDGQTLELNKQISQKSLNKSYQIQRKISQIGNIFSPSNTPKSQFPDIIEPKQKNVFDKKEQNEDILNLNYFSINDQYASIISAGMNEQQKYKRIRLGNNRITNNGLKNMLSTMPTSIKSLDISYNSFNHLGIQPLIERITHSEFQSLTEINLEGNNLGDISISKLLTAFTDNSKLKKLNLSKNQLSIQCIPQLCIFIVQSPSIQELYLSWNKFKGEEGYKIGEALIDNGSIRVIDLSYNSLGVQSSKDIDQFVCANIFAQLIERDYKSDIIHIDLSYNQFNFQSSTIISKALQQNTSIIGFHFSGNYAYLDQYGFLHPIQHVKHLNAPNQTRISGVTRVEKSNQTMDIYKDHCWICSGWQEKLFVWRPLISGNVQDEPIFIHISAEGYQPRKMEKEVNGNLVCFTYRGMYPPNQKIQYFFIAHGNVLFAKEQTNEVVNLKNVEINYQDETIVLQEVQILNIFNTCKISSTVDIFDSNTYEYQLKTYPRKVQPLYIKPQYKELKLIWNLNMSAFYEYQNELDEQILDNCFEFDVKYSQIEQYISYDFLGFKKQLRTHYKQIKDLFKYYSCLKPFLGERWTIPIEIFIEILNSGQVDIVDEKNLKICSIAIIFEQCNQNEKKNNNTPHNHLARVAEIKYIQTGLAQDHKKALELLFEKGLNSVCNQIQCEHSWRMKNLWNQDIDLVLQYYKPLINYIFNKYSSRQQPDYQLQQVIQQTLNHQNYTQNQINQATCKFMSLNDFKAFVYENIKEFSMLSTTDIHKCFNLSIQTQVDTINKNRHLYMNLIEFYESLTRLANLLIIYPVGYDYLNECTLQSFKDIHLYCKLESMLVKIFEKRKDETSQLQDISVSKTSLFDQKIREFLQANYHLPSQPKQSLTINNLNKITNKDEVMKKRASIALPTPIHFAQSTYQNSNPEFEDLQDHIIQDFNSLKNQLHNGQIVRRSNSLLINTQSIYFKPPSNDEFQNTSNQIASLKIISNNSKSKSQSQYH